MLDHTVGQFCAHLVFQDADLRLQTRLNALTLFR